jgi:membrane-associated PAP2 superfamily phosphatase
MWMATNFMTPVVLRSKPLAGKPAAMHIEPLPGLLEVALIAAICGGPGTHCVRLPKLTSTVGADNLAGVVADLRDKAHSHTSCPWDLKRFGGVAVWHVSTGRWAWPTVEVAALFPGSAPRPTGFAFLGALP